MHLMINMFACFILSIIQWLDAIDLKCVFATRQSFVKNSGLKTSL